MAGDDPSEESKEDSKEEKLTLRRVKSYTVEKAELC
jgi:hypothetical protein